MLQFLIVVLDLKIHRRPSDSYRTSRSHGRHVHGNRDTEAVRLTRVVFVRHNRWFDTITLPGRFGKIILSNQQVILLGDPRRIAKSLADPKKRSP